eukprot:360766-Amphidinium_carterae.1
MAPRQPSRGCLRFKLRTVFLHFTWTPQTGSEVSSLLFDGTDLVPTSNFVTGLVTDLRFEFV